MTLTCRHTENPKIKILHENSRFLAHTDRESDPANQYGHEAKNAAENESMIMKEKVTALTEHEND